MKIYLGSDHAGFELKESVKQYLEDKGHEVIDIGAHTNDSQDDYPDFIIPTAEKVAADSSARGIVFGGSGQGEAIAANKVKGVRAALYYGGPTEIVTLSREHNNANILSLGGRFVDPAQAQKIITLWLESQGPTEERHNRRLQKISDYESMR
ncbi:ribose-5-phosphate isomerase [Candidatus Peregrinibacteria bacterium CG11_big_fil_rev_8_21_14_0_20_46_8]|nr:MAG: ribose-5-phosphate isomerase [Candidatus Peregrinibacteria bacterium CG11_big_fil_rev_8_21_14_0_20_46_8]